MRAELMVISDAFHALKPRTRPTASRPESTSGCAPASEMTWLRLGPMKIFTDGSLVGRTAAMSAPYDGDPGNGDISSRGYLQATPTT